MRDVKNSTGTLVSGSSKQTFRSYCGRPLAIKPVGADPDLFSFFVASERESQSRNLRRRRSVIEGRADVTAVRRRARVRPFSEVTSVGDVRSQNAGGHLRPLRSENDTHCGY